jgi:CPA1 family monovalent cation:H+ antiporter
VLIGLEVQTVIRNLGVGGLGRLTLVVLAVWIGLLLVRFSFQTMSVSLIRLLDRRTPSGRAG